MFFSGESMNSDGPKLGILQLRVPKEEALRKSQELFLEGRQTNALYICTHEELKTAEKKKLSWIASSHELLGKLTVGADATDFFDEVILNVLKDSDPIEALSEQFHNELNQRLERLRAIRKAIEDAADVPAPTRVAVPAADASPAAPAPRRAASPMPKPVEVAPKADELDALTVEVSGVSSATGVLEAGAADLDSSSQKPARRSASAPAPQSGPTKVILILCSRNGTARQALCRFGNQMNLNFEIVDYNPDQPSGMIDQLYRHRDAKFAVVYWGEPTGRELPGSAHPERYVGFSLGFALGRLGRGRVFIMGSTTTPPIPGFNRILVSQLDSGGGWQIQLARRMKAAGLPVDFNKLS